MNFIRAFVAIELGEPIRIALRDLQRRLQQTGADIRWVRPENIHLTLAFIAKLPENQIEPLIVALDAASKEKAFELSIIGTGTFGSLPNPRVLWAGIAPNLPLERVQQITAESLRAAGVEFDEKQFSPHLTLGRFRSSSNLQSLRQQLEKEQQVALGFTKVHELQLIQSKLTPEGARYSVLHRFPLGR